MATNSLITVIPLFYPYYTPNCDDFESIESAFSEDTDTEFKNGKYSCM